MHAFPPAEDWHWLIGDEIAQVRLDPFSVQFAFSGGRILLVEFRFEHVEADGTTWGYDCQGSPKPQTAVHRLLYDPIIAVQRDDLRLTIQFEQGASLTVFSELGPYECGQVNGPGEFILAF